MGWIHASSYGFTLYGMGCVDGASAVRTRVSTLLYPDEEPRGLSRRITEPAINPLVADFIRREQYEML